MNLRSSATTAVLISRAITIAAAIASQAAGLYAGVVTFGVWNTIAIYAIGALAFALQEHITRRSTSC